MQADIDFKGKLGSYKSSETASREFCTSCGSPVVFKYTGDKVQLTLYLASEANLQTELLNCVLLYP